MTDFEARRKQMIERHLITRGIHDEGVLAAMGTVPREVFVMERWLEDAYADGALPIEEGQTISQPYVVAAMTQELEVTSDDRVLEIGTGSGYAAAVLSRIAHHVYTVERNEKLADQARRRCRALGYMNVDVLHGDGTLGWPEHAPFDGIVVTAAGPAVPPSLLGQLAIGGRLVMPVGAEWGGQRIVRIRHPSPEEYPEEKLERVVFVPLIGAEGWEE